MLLLALSLSTANMLLLGVVCAPLSDRPVRLTHLYSSRPGLHLLIAEDGQVHGSAQQTPYSLLEIWPVDPGCVVIRGAATARFLCIQSDGRLFSSQTFSRDDCRFREQILPDGYSVYVSDAHGALLSLGNQRQRLQGRDRGVPALAQFLPRAGDADRTSAPGPDVPERLQQSTAPPEEPVDSMDSFGKLSQVIHSPSFHRR
ncbi:fibroblast growth factor 19 [Clinocottus analis]|uniref:fibroblast growth factor 19 n=1 Tax=Clinocottus analis TaxID=304258 RepID=UPI0035C0E642